MRSLAIRFASLACLGVAGLLLTISVLAAQSPEADPQSKALAMLNAAPETVGIEPGETLYVRYENYERHGPNAEQIAKFRNLATERSIRETWYEVGADRLVVRSVSRVIDANGDVIQLDITRNGKLESMDPRTGNVLADTEYLPWSIDDGFTRLAGVFADSLAAGTVRLVSVTDAQVAIESDVELNKDDDWQERVGFEVPFYYDLAPESGLMRNFLDADGIGGRWEYWAVLPDGDEVLLSSSTLTDFRVVDKIPEDYSSVQ
jgi:hypothetical protein